MKTHSRFAIVLLQVLALSFAAYASTYTESVPYTFPRNLTGPTSLVADSSGNYYGLTSTGDSNLGGIFELSPSSSGWTATPIYSFTGGTDGSYPVGSLVIDSSGNLYGAVGDGGAGTTCGISGCGYAYELSPSSSGWTKTTLYSFNTTDGANPYGTLIFDSAGNLYGITTFGGAYGHGAVFELSPSSSGWTEKTLYSFKGGLQGNAPNGGLVSDAQGRLYGTTQYGGTGCLNGCGTIFQLSPPTSTVSWWTYHRVHLFTGKDGENPNGPSLTVDAAGNLYGTTSTGGNSLTGEGVVYQLSPTSSGGWKLNVLHSFSNLNDGNIPQGGVVFDAAGNLWGTADAGGHYGWGTVFEMTKTAGHWSLINRHSFSNANGDGSHPQCLPLFDSAGNVFGTTTGGGTPPAGYGTFWELSPSAAAK